MTICRNCKHVDFDRSFKDTDEHGARVFWRCSASGLDPVSGHGKMLCAEKNFGNCPDFESTLGPQGTTWLMKIQKAIA